MAKKFIYDSAGYYEATFTEGTHNGTVFSASSSMTNEGRLFDQSLTSAVTSFDSGDAIKIDLGSAVAVSAIALYFSSSEADNLTLYGSANSNLASPSTTNAMTSTFPAGWTVATFTEDTKQYWSLRSTSGVIANLTEFFIGTEYTFDQEPSVGSVTGKEYGNELHKTIGGREFSFKHHDSKSTWDFKFDFLDSGAKGKLVSLRDGVVGGHKKFLYYDGTSYSYVRMNEGSLNFTEVLPSVFNTSVKLVQQLS